MKTFQNYLRVSLLMVILTAYGCGSRKLSLANSSSKQTDQVLTTISKASEVAAVTNDQVSQKKNASDSTRILENQDFSIKSDKATYNQNTGNLIMEGNVSLTGSAKRNTQFNKKQFEDYIGNSTLLVHTSELKDSSVLKKTETSTQTRVKNLDVKRGVNWWLVIPFILFVLLVFNSKSR